MRMFYACAHQMLKITEVPLFIESGFEVIPTEVTPPIITSLVEGIKYDDPLLPINQLWINRLTIPFEIAQIISRARLWEREGIISEEEKDLFNRYIDVIYLHNRLNHVYEIAKWFKGKVLFRYYGDIAYNIPNLNFMLNITTEKKSVLNKVVFLPIFNLLQNEPIADYFDIKIPLHNYLDKNIVPERWRGFKKDSPCVIVLSEIERYKSYQRMLKRVVPLTKHFPIILLGKNRIDLLPKFITKSFIIKTGLSREEFFKELFSSQILLYPRSKKNHSHNIPIEAIYGGMPVVLRTRTPTFIENDHPFEDRLHPSKIGAARTAYGFNKLVLSLYNSKERLEELIKEQYRLITPYKKSSVNEELQNLINYLEKTLPKRKDPTEIIYRHTFPLATFPANVVYTALKNIVNDSFEAPIYYFILDHRLNDIKEIDTGEQKIIALHLKPTKWHIRRSIYYLKLFLGPQLGDVTPLYFSGNGQLHKFSIECYAKGKGEITGKIKILVDNQAVKVYTLNRKINCKTLVRCDINFELTFDEPFQILLYIRSSRDTETYLHNIMHKHA